MPEVATKLKTYRFDQMAVQVKDKVHPDDADVDRYVGLEHIDPESLKIRRWGEPSDVESTKILFRAGDIIFGKRRAYQRKLAVADFDGICSAHAMVLRPKTDVVLKEFLPFFMQTDTFMERAVKISVGGLSPTINWKDLAKEEFALPPIEEQRRLVRTLAATAKTEEALFDLYAATESVFRSSIDQILHLPKARKPVLPESPAGWRVAPLEALTDQNRQISYGILKPGDHKHDGVPMLRIMDFDDFGRRTDTTPMRVSRAVADTSKTTYLQSGDLLVSVMATIGRLFIVPEEMEGWNVNRALAVLPARDSISNRFLEAYLHSGYVRRVFEVSQIGSAQLRINLEFLKQLPVPIPPLSVQSRVIETREEIALALAKLRDRVSEIRSVRGKILQEAHR